MASQTQSKALTQSAANKAMNQLERSALIRVVSSRMKVYRKNAVVMRTRLRRQIFQRVMEESQVKLNAARDEMNEVRAEAEALQERAKKIVAKHSKGGIALGSARFIDSEWQLARHQEPYVELNLHAIDDPMSFTLDNQWVDRSIKARVDEEFAKLEEEYQLGDLHLAEVEQKLVEEILLGNVPKDAQDEFLAKVPSLEALPDPKKVVAQLGS